MHCSGYAAGPFGAHDHRECAVRRGLSLFCTRKSGCTPSGPTGIRPGFLGTFPPKRSLLPTAVPVNPRSGRSLSNVGGFADEDPWGQGAIIRKQGPKVARLRRRQDARSSVFGGEVCPRERNLGPPGFGDAEEFFFTPIATTETLGFAPWPVAHPVTGVPGGCWS
jgi:hypothetical protein